MSRQRSRRLPPRRVRREALKLLEHARELIATPGQFTCRASARDRHLHPVAFNSPRAVRFCAGGALLRAEADLHGLGYAAMDEDYTFRPLRLEWAFAYLGENLARAQIHKRGPILIDYELLEAAAPEILRLAALLRELQPSSHVGWAAAVFALNEERTVSHSQILAAYEEAIADAQRELQPRSWRRKR